MEQTIFIGTANISSIYSWKKYNTTY